MRVWFRGGRLLLLMSARIIAAVIAMVSAPTQMAAMVETMSQGFMWLLVRWVLAVFVVCFEPV